MSNLISVEVITNKILFIRGKKVMLDSDLALLYGVRTKRLNEQVKRNKKRFPDDFMFQLTPNEKEEVVAICDHLKALKFSPQLPFAFTEQGVAMLSSVLRSKKAILVNIAIMRVFVRLRSILSTHTELAVKLRELESRIEGHDADIRDIFEAIRQLMGLPAVGRRITGFTTAKDS